MPRRTLRGAGRVAGFVDLLPNQCEMWVNMVKTLVNIGGRSSLTSESRANNWVLFSIFFPAGGFGIQNNGSGRIRPRLLLFLGNHLGVFTSASEAKTLSASMTKT